MRSLKTVEYLQLTIMVLTGLLPSAILLASDRDLPPYMIYIDPETGKYTTKVPSHPPANTQNGGAAVRKTSSGPRSKPDREDPGETAKTPVAIEK